MSPSTSSRRTGASSPDSTEVHEPRSQPTRTPPPCAGAGASVLAALADPPRATQPVGGRFGQTTFEQLAGRMLDGDTLVHTWDLSRATGQDEDLDPEAVQATLAWIAPLAAQLRVPGGFGPELDPPPAADPQTRLLCFPGRRV